MSSKWSLATLFGGNGRPIALGVAVGIVLLPLMRFALAPLVVPGLWYLGLPAYMRSFNESYSRECLIRRALTRTGLEASAAVGSLIHFAHRLDVRRLIPLARSEDRDMRSTLAAFAAAYWQDLGEGGDSLLKAAVSDNDLVIRNRALVALLKSGIALGDERGACLDIPSG